MVYRSDGVIRRIIPGRRFARLPLLCLSAATVVLCDFAIEYNVSPCCTLCRNAFLWAAACKVAGLLVDRASSAAFGATGRWIYKTRRPCKLSPLRWFQRFTIAAGTPKLLATLSTVSAFRIL